MLEPVAPGIWHQQHHFSVLGVRASSRMTVVRLADGKLWLHSPVPISAEMKAELAALGEVAFIVAPNRFHHLYAGDCAAAFPSAVLYGARGLAKKRPDLQMRVLRDVPEPEWESELDQVLVEGMPALNETVWFHRASRTLIVTDLCQYVGGGVPLSARLYTGLMGVYRRLAVSRAVRLAIKDRAALARSVERILAWDFDRVILSHNLILERDAYAGVKRALEAAL